MGIDIRGVVKEYGENRVLDDVSLEVADGEFVSLIGPSGVGKTTLLKILAGLETPDAGSISFDETPSRDRPVIMVFQDFSLFPHMNVSDNVSYGLRVRRRPRPEVKERTERILDWFGIGDKAHAFPAKLSAGQKQRAAIARALVVEPMVILLDEPFANLDKNLKGETAAFIRRTQKEFGITTVMVTHDQEEAFVTSDRIGVMIDGRLRQYDEPERLFLDPADLETARFLGPVNTVGRDVVKLLHVERLPEGSGPVSFRTEAVSLEPCPSGTGTVLDYRINGKLIHYRVAVGDTVLNVHGTDGSHRPGDRVAVKLSHVIDERSTR